MKTAPIFAFAALLFAAVPASAADAPSAVGFWVTADHGAVIAISECGDHLCGNLVQFRDDDPPDNWPLDIHNPDAARRADPLCNILLMGGLMPVPGKPTKWENGWVYDPENGSTYSAEMQLDGPDRLKLRGYLGISLLGRTETWTRETAAPHRCAKPG
jgi:uncharacterized protein (DUF2147 family)